MSLYFYMRGASPVARALPHQRRSWATDLSVWTSAPVAPTARFAVRDVWAARDMGVFTGSYTARNVPSHGVAMLILTPA